jgi:peptidoglycan/xylan/chitin deacetylase (PgdA/CDA1 family)
MEIRWDKLAASGVIRTGMLAAAEKVEARMPNILRILAYHRIGLPDEEDGSLDPSLLNTTPVQFAEQMAYLKDNYYIVSAEELIHTLENRGGLPPRSVMVTFDDGYRDFQQQAWPVLSGMQIPAVLFVATDFMNGNGRWYWWDSLYNAFTHTKCSELALPPYGNWQLETDLQRRQAGQEVKMLLMNMDHRPAMDFLDRIVEALNEPQPKTRLLLNWSELALLKQDGLSIAAHTRSHPILSRVSLKTVQEEVSGSLQDLREHLGGTLPIFAYPVGHQADLNRYLPGILHNEGIQAAVTMIAGHNVLGKIHPLQLRRVGMAPHMTLNEFRLALTGFFNIYGVVEKIRERRL